mmetsp:Transcript_15794/g.25717  ORF Transcript_15794/g.25717 Transcript_15794/m.25717 type:complete len:114 (-) Transcript_15794:55-396(-)|eukprot:CAMPEP_0169071202 /NCGR_PEP_ID=MMETSP1015-20121227/5533_1 /TAXON_ID=342587 /ORGANISM="Karlodinium micrum, Strain CCMP2283" /LENGTH=113 /DNA_ID=CAMNT_0009130271 /DNA_START=58 /DNA_END=399 /DNA_ORIENTATION=-
MSFLNLTTSLLVLATYCMTITDARSSSLLRAHSVPKNEVGIIHTASQEMEEDTKAAPYHATLIGQVDEVMEDEEAARGMPTEPPDAVVAVSPQPKHVSKGSGVYNYITGEYTL